MVFLGVAVDIQKGLMIVEGIARAYPEDLRDYALSFLPFRNKNRHTAEDESESDTGRYRAIVASAVIDCYKDRRSRYSGSLNDCLTDSLREYRNLLLDLESTEKQGLRLLHKIFADESSSFYDSICESCFDLHNAWTKMEAEFNSTTRQNYALRECRIVVYLVPPSRK
jgi:hypothetical protein